MGSGSIDLGSSDGSGTRLIGKVETSRELGMYSRRRRRDLLAIQRLRLSLQLLSLRHEPLFCDVDLRLKVGTLAIGLSGLHLPDARAHSLVAEGRLLHSKAPKHSQSEEDLQQRRI